MKAIFWCFIISFLAFVKLANAQTTENLDFNKPRAIVLLNQSNSHSVYKNQYASFIKLLLYSNEIEIQGIIVDGEQNTNNSISSYINQVLSAYDKVHSNLVFHDRYYPSAIELKSLLKYTNTYSELKEVGNASEFFINTVENGDPRPVWVLVLGSSNPLELTLDHIKKTKGVNKTEQFISQLRVISSIKDLSLRPLKDQYPYLVWFDCVQFKNKPINKEDLLDKQPLIGKTELENIYLKTAEQDNHERQDGFLFLAFNGLNDFYNPEWGSWGGRFIKNPTNPNHYFQILDSLTLNTGATSIAGIWYPSIENDFLNRFNWCFSTYNKANHAPNAVIKNTLFRTVTSGTKIILSAEGSSDPDLNKLSYSWKTLNNAGTWKGHIEIYDSTSIWSSFYTPRVKTVQTIHIILTVTDNGIPPLSNYKRLVATVQP